MALAEPAQCTRAECTKTAVALHRARSNTTKLLVGKQSARTKSARKRTAAQRADRTTTGWQLQRLITLDELTGGLTGGHSEGISL